MAESKPLVRLWSKAMNDAYFWFWICRAIPFAFCRDTVGAMMPTELGFFFENEEYGEKFLDSLLVWNILVVPFDASMHSNSILLNKFSWEYTVCQIWSGIFTQKSFYNLYQQNDFRVNQW